MADIKLLPIDQVKFNAGNPRIIKDAQFKKLVQSLKDFPEMSKVRPVVINKDDIVLGGNQRLKAMKEAGWEEIPTVKVDWSEEKAQEFIIKDNLGYGEWEWEAVVDQWSIEDLDKWGLDVPKEWITTKEAEEDDYEIPDEIETNIVLGDLIEIGEHRLLCGDSTDPDQVDKLMDGQLADMVFTDPPYGVDYEGGHNKKKRVGIENDKLQNQDLSDLFRDSLNVACIYTKSNAPFYVWYASGKSMQTFDGLSHTMLEVRAIICWYKVNSGLGAFMAQYIPNYEPCIYAHKSGESIQWFGATDEKTIWELKNDQKNKLHITQKPIELPQRAINNSSKTNQVVYDAFLGSGSTMVAAHQLNRKCYAMELDPKYCQVVIDRMRKLEPLIDVKINGKEYYNHAINK